MIDVFVDDPKLMLDRTLADVSDYLQLELDERIKNGSIPVTGMVLEGYSNEGMPVRLEVRLSVREE